MIEAIRERIETAVGAQIERCAEVGAGAAGTVLRAWLAGGGTVIVKVAAAKHPGLDLEARMLRVLAERSKLPVPAVRYAEREVLVMEDMPGAARRDEDAERHAAELLSALHGVVAVDGRYGLDFDAALGPLPQCNQWEENWPKFFAKHRLRPALARTGGTLGPGLTRRVEAVIAALPDLLPPRPPASLLHGDVWSGNVLVTTEAAGTRISAFLDPSVYYGHAEVELAFIALFDTFGATFFAEYRKRRSIGPESFWSFWRTRRHVYNVYPLLVHVQLFGGAYRAQLESTLEQIGF